jgi:cell volume regulation protein A
MLAGSEGPGGIDFNNPWFAQALGVVALAFILFSGGLDTDWANVRPVLGQAVTLSTFGVFITAGLVGLFVSFFLDFTLLEGLLFGAIISSTDAAATFSILRTRSIRLKGNLEPLLELESGSNDPMAVFLTMAFTALLGDPTASVIELIPMFLLQMALGAAAGYGLGRLMVLMTNRVRLEYDGLYPVLTISYVLLAYGLTTFLGGNGFLAVYLAGIVLGNSNFIHKRSLLQFHDGLAWLMQIIMFLTLGLLVFPSNVIPLVGAGLLVSAFLIFIGRPVSIGVTLFFTRLNLREKAMISWVGLRGAVPIILATFPLLEGLPKAQLIFNLVFFIVLTSVLLQGTFLPAVAKWLKVAAPLPPKSEQPLAIASPADLKNDLVEIEVPPTSKVVGRSIVSLRLPRETLIVLIGRNDDFFVPHGSTVLRANDRLLILADKDQLDEVQSVLES